MERGTDSFTDFVAARSGRLVRVAYLIVQDPDRAERVTRSALTSLRRRWADQAADGRPYATALGLVVRGCLARPGRAGRDSQPADTAYIDRVFGDAPDDEAGHASADSAVRAAYAALPPRERAILVLELVEDQDPDQIVALIGGTSADVDASRRAALQAVAAASRAAPDAREASDRDVLDRLRHVLIESSRAEPIPTELEVAPARRRPALSRRAVLVGGAATATAVAGAAFLRRPRATTPTSAPTALPTRPLSTQPPFVPSWDSMLKWPARGALVDSRRILEAAAARGEIQRPLYADIIGGRPVAVFLDQASDGITSQAPYVPLVTGRFDPDLTRPQWFSGAGPDDGMLSIATTATGPGPLRLVTRPDVTSVRVSRTITYDRAGGTTRSGWVDVPLVKGIGDTTTGPGGAVMAAVMTPTGIHPVTVGSADLDAETPPPTAPTAARARARLLSTVTQKAADYTGVDVARVRSEILFDVATPKGDATFSMALPRPEEGSVIAILTTLANGAQARSFGQVWRSFNSWGYQTSDFLVPGPAGVIGLQPIILTGPAPNDTSIRVAVLDPRATSVRLVPPAGGTTKAATRKMAHGYVTFDQIAQDDGDRVSIETLDARGRLIARTTIYSAAGDWMGYTWQ